jgi:hypothetical protein
MKLVHAVSLLIVTPIDVAHLAPEEALGPPAWVGWTKVAEQEG